LTVTHEEYREMLAAYALGALDGPEARALEEHLATCRECGAQAADWLNAANALALTAAPVEPPLELRARILESVRTINQSSSTGGTGGGAEAGRAAAQSSEGERKSESNVVEMRPAASRRRSTPVWFGAIAAAVAIVSLTAALLVLWYRFNELQRQYERERSAVEVLTRQATEEREARELLTAPGARTAQLAGTAVAKDASAKLAFDPQTGRAMLFAHNLPPAPPGKAYQLWYIEDLAHPVPGGVFNTDARGGAVLHDRVPEAGRKASVFAVTLEPQTGVSAPTGDKYLLSPIS
jgi:anti-sigma-K factor RskA